MARTVTWDELRDLAGFEAENGYAISVYLDLDPSLVPTAGDAHTRLNSLGDGAAKENGGRELTHQQRLALRDDLERIRRYFDAEFERNGAHGLAIFCAGLDNVWRPLPLTEVVPDRIKVHQLLDLAPLVPLVGRGEERSSSSSAGSRGASTGSASRGGSRISPITSKSSRGATTRAAWPRHDCNGTRTSRATST